ncbi:MAG: hypothetical protein NZM31_06990 [Gemmatales bacterium]|nr:hypothetical protein [Gemmatales bacterium]MDW8386747.1 hypothetical protein [Gemmatales bacterium]
MSKRELRDRLRLALGAFVLGGFIGAAAGAVLGTGFGLFLGMPERGLDGALLGALLAGGSGALAACLVPPHRSATLSQAASAGEPAREDSLDPASAPSMRNLQPQ